MTTTLKNSLSRQLEKLLSQIYPTHALTVELQHSHEEFMGDFTLLTFPFVKELKKKPEEIGEEIGQFLISNNELITGYNVVKGFLNLSIKPELYKQVIEQPLAVSNQNIPENTPKILVEFSSPNTNKPLHLGHIRNNLLGSAISNILSATHKNVSKVQLINDRGIHICKSMVSWQQFAEGSNPESRNIKGDHFVGEYYVLYDKVYKEQVNELIIQGKNEEEAKKEAPIFKEAQNTLIKWEKNDPDTLWLWEMMNEWVYTGFNETYKRLGVSFDENQYESNTYILGKEIVEEGLQKGVFYRKPDNSVWCDLTEDGLDEKLLLRADGTSVYITQDLGTAVERLKKHQVDKLIYTVGNEQDYHFKVLFSILDKLGYDASKKLFHLSYAMVDLPDGKMKSREGTVIDADDLMEEMHQTAKNIAEERGRLDGLSPQEKIDLYEKIGLGALKYYILKIDPKKRILFNPKESIDFQGNTGPFIQYTYARIQSLLAKQESHITDISMPEELLPEERDLLRWLDEYPGMLTKAAEDLNPSIIANYVYDLVRKYNHYYQSVPILKTTEEIKNFRLALSQKVGEMIKTCLSLLGIEVIERM